MTLSNPYAGIIRIRFDGFFSAENVLFTVLYRLNGCSRRFNVLLAGQAIRHQHQGFPHPVENGLF
ncbi:hypothetical protein EPIR_2950 [Erwinia piriflorinigrans CFBP 5888]|uniref:Uncharacterized protein n=1 Tax=Erwinia piriflorinigrans CFBP 5888 TaxID=1161919 RepID=V5ZAB7_9GAMM|nr:hypothetical protein EPIR_2950 [Erwinia piriflorinigrans CFBP 5888]